MKTKYLPIARIVDYEFLGLYKPNENKEQFFYVYDIQLDNKISGRIFHSSVYDKILMKGDIVEYEFKNDNKLVVRIPKQKPIYINHKNQE